MNVKLFDTDPYLAECVSVVEKCESAKDGFNIYLDKTIFYPRGGGQPSDKGTINGQEILDVFEDKIGVAHLVKNAIEIGQEVNLVLDFDFRY